MELTIKQIKTKIEENITFVGSTLVPLDLIIYPEIKNIGDKNLLFFLLYYSELEAQNKITEGWRSKTRYRLSNLIYLIMDTNNQFFCNRNRIINDYEKVIIKNSDKLFDVKLVSNLFRTPNKSSKEIKKESEERKKLCLNVCDILNRKYNFCQ